MKPSPVPYPTEPHVVVGGELVTKVAGLVFVSQYHEDHTISLTLKNGATVTLKLRQERQRIREKKAEKNSSKAPDAPPRPEPAR